MKGKIVTLESFLIPFEHVLREEWKKPIDDLPERPHPDVFICPFHDRPTDFTYYVREGF